MIRSRCSTLVAWAWLAMPAASFLASAPARADVVLNEVLYDPAGADEGGEWVELWNADPVPRSLDGIAIEAADGSRPDAWVSVYRGAPADTIPPHAPFLIRSDALSTSLQNGPDALRLIRDGSVLDLLGYGALDAAALYEGAPAPDAASGHSLARRADGAGDGRNADDWEEEPSPTPGRANHPDERLSLVPAGFTLDPVVPWPGEIVLVRARVANRGRLPIVGARWRLVADWDDSFPVGGRAGSLPAAVAPGVALAPGESAWVELRFDAPPEGPFRARVRAAAADGLPDSEAFADTVSVVGRTLAAPAVVNEVAFRDAGAGEWVEIWFREPVADIGSLAIGDGVATPRPLARGAGPRPAPAGAFLVVAQDPSAVRERYGLDSTAVLGVVGGWPALNDTDGPGGIADAVRVTAGAIPSDVILYDARAAARGGSLERLSPDLPGHLPGTFAESVDPARATPGRANSLRAPDRGQAPRGALLVASGRLLRPDAGAPPLLLRLTAEARGRSLVVRVYDLLGRRVRTLVQGQRFASEGAFAWDGRDAAGEWVRPGLYVIAAEAAAGDGQGPRRTAIPVAVSAATGAAP